MKTHKLALTVLLSWRADWRSRITAACRTICCAGRSSVTVYTAPVPGRSAAHSACSRRPAGIELVEQTAILPAQAGLHFGFCVSVTGAVEDGDLDLEKVILHPPVFDADGKVSTGYEQEIELVAKDGEATACLGHTIEPEAEAVPGRWTVRLMAADQVIAEKTFELR